MDFNYVFIFTLALHTSLAQWDSYCGDTGGKNIDINVVDKHTSYHTIATKIIVAKNFHLIEKRLINATFCDDRCLLRQVCYIEATKMHTLLQFMACYSLNLSAVCATFRVGTYHLLTYFSVISFTCSCPIPHNRPSVMRPHTCL